MKTNREKWVVFCVVAGLVGGSGAFLNRLQAGHKLGEPGLKMVERPVYDETGTNVVCATTIDLPYRVQDYVSIPLPVTTNEWGMLPKDTTYGRRSYRAKDGFRTDISIVLMGKDRESIHRPQICLSGQGWTIDREEVVTVPIPKPAPYDLSVMKLSLSKGAQRGFFVYWFVSDQRMTARHGERIWWMTLDLLKSGVLSRWAYVAYFTVCEPGQEQATFGRMKEFMAATVPQFQVVNGAGGGVSTSAALKFP